MTGWSPDSWRERPVSQSIRYDDPSAVEAVVARLRALPPLVAPGEIDRLRWWLAEAERGRAFVLQGGDCAESFDECREDFIRGKLELLSRMSALLALGRSGPVVRIGRLGGQYAKPRSSPTEVRRGADARPVEVPSYFGDLINDAAFSPEARRLDPRRMLDAYHHAALTMNFVRSLHAEEAERPLGSLHRELHALARMLPAGLRDEYLQGLGAEEGGAGGPSELFCSHEGLSLLYEHAQTRPVSARPGYYDLTTHLPWIGERTRALDGAHVEFFRGVRNPVGVKLGPAVLPEEAVALAEVLNPSNEPGRLAFIVRMGAAQVERGLPPLLEAVRRSGRSVLWLCDPMHGNTRVAREAGVKTRHFDDVLRELVAAFEIHRACGSTLGGVHLELTSDEVTECLGGAAGITERELGTRYTTRCDPRLNVYQALELALRLGLARAGSNEGARRRELDG